MRNSLFINALPGMTLQYVVLFEGSRLVRCHCCKALTCLLFRAMPQRDPESSGMCSWVMDPDQVRGDSYCDFYGFTGNVQAY